MEVTEITRRCPMDGTITVVKMLTSDYERWQGGELIQRAMPEMSIEDRETLITGLCAPCQGPIFTAPEED